MQLKSATRRRNIYTYELCTCIFILGARVHKLTLYDLKRDRPLWHSLIFLEREGNKGLQMEFASLWNCPPSICHKLNWMLPVSAVFKSTWPCFRWFRSTSWKDNGLFKIWRLGHCWTRSCQNPLSASSSLETAQAWRAMRREQPLFCHHQWLAL